MKPRSAIEFGVRELKNDGGNLLVAGMCFDTPLRMPGRVVQIYRLLPPAGLTLIELAKRTDVDFVISDQEEVDWKIEGITVYGKTVTEVPAGHTAILRLSGNGMHFVTAKHVLGINEERT